MSHLFHKLALRVSNNSRRIMLYKNNAMTIKRKYVSQMRSMLAPSNLVLKNNSCRLKLLGYRRCTTSPDDEFIEGEDHFDHDVVDDIHSKQFLYPENQDEIIDKLSSSTAVQDVFNIIKDYKDLKHYHACQSVLVLWQLQKAYCNCYLSNLDKFDINFSLDKMMNNYKNEIKHHPEFEKLMRLLETNAGKLSVLELTCSLFNLKKMGLAIDHPVMDSLIHLAHSSICERLEDWSLQSGALFTAVFEPKDNLRGIYITKGLLPLYFNAMDSIKTFEDIEMITIGLHHLHIMISKSFLEKYISVLRNFLENNPITIDHSQMLTKVLIFLNLPHWSRENSEVIDYVLSFFKDFVKDLNAPELITVYKTCNIQSSSGYLRNVINQRGHFFLEQSKSDDRVSTFVRVPDLLLCQLTTSSNYSKFEADKLLRDCLQHSFPPMLMVLYKVLRHLKYSKSNIPKVFWQKCVDTMLTENVPDYLLLRLMFRYMYCNNNLGPCHRSYEFERAILQHCLNSRNGIMFHVPWKLTRILSFFIAFGLDKNSPINFNTLQSIIVKLDSVKRQLGVFDWFVLSRGLHLANMSNQLIPNSASNVILREVNLLLNEATFKIVNSNDKLNFDELCCVTTMFNFRGTKSDSEEFIRLVCKLESSKDVLTARRVRDLCQNLSGSRIVLPRLFERCVDFLVKQGDLSLGETLQRILFTFFMVGYIPVSEEFFQTAVKIIGRDKNAMNCLSLLQFSNALCFFGHLSEPLVKHIFSIEFMDRIDKEIESSYSQVQYTMRIRKSLMQLNRSVCLEMPQYDIPWFHEKYIEGLKAYTPRSKSVIYEDVLSSLVRVVGTKDALNLQHFSPYGYKTDFLVELDKNNRIIKNSTRSTKHREGSKVAITVIDSKTFSKHYNVSDDPSVPIKIKLIPNGILLMRRRHLELMGYKVLDIHPSLWNSMHMSEPNEKCKYLQRGIFEN